MVRRSVIGRTGELSCARDASIYDGRPANAGIRWESVIVYDVDRDELQVERDESEREKYKRVTSKLPAERRWMLFERFCYRFYSDYTTLNFIDLLFVLYW